MVTAVCRAGVAKRIPPLRGLFLCFNFNVAGGSPGASHFLLFRQEKVTADSNTKCNDRVQFNALIDAMIKEYFCRRSIFQGLSWSSVERPGNLVEFPLRVDRQVCVLGQILAQQSVRVLIDTSLPWTMRVGEINLQPRALGELRMQRHLFALISLCLDHRSAFCAASDPTARTPSRIPPALPEPRNRPSLPASQTRFVDPPVCPLPNGWPCL